MIFVEKTLPFLEIQGFKIKQDTIAGEVCYLVDGSFATWDKDNLIYRASIFNENGKPVSLSFSKFFNWGEKPNIVPEPVKLSNCNFISKIDGSTCIISKYKGNLIVRTRGSFFIDSEKMTNGFEIETLKKKYPKAFDNEYINSEEYSLIFEWVSDINVIVLKYNDCPNMYLINKISHKDFSYETQNNLDKIAKELGCIRPSRGTFSSDIKEMLEQIKSLKGEEGYCVYFNNDQDIKKIKSSQYLTLHAFKSEINNEENVIDLYVEYKQPDYNDFLDRIEKEFDFECRKYIEHYVSKIVSYRAEVRKIVEHMKEFSYSFNGTRKEFAQKNIASYGQTERSGMVFKIYDRKDLDKKDYKRLYFQVMKK
jgi:hypothetical protein